ncbi:hypothetical protein Syun_006340 [Stephania yunnanensis]|uniref:Uncharacterized protein n=1 Tax=Stephania yunnanensis TaxID=152371 RepID=A0AAP0PZ78_9MAGN
MDVHNMEEAYDREMRYADKGGMGTDEMESAEKVGINGGEEQRLRGRCDVGGGTARRSCGSGCQLSSEDEWAQRISCSRAAARSDGGANEGSRCNGEPARRSAAEARGQQLQRDWSPARRAVAAADDAKARMANSSSGPGGGAAVGKDDEQRHGPPGCRRGAVTLAMRSCESAAAATR